MPKMTIAELLPIWAENPVAFEQEPQHIREAYADAVEAVRDGAKVSPSGKLKRPRGDRDVLPPGYSTEHVGGSYVFLVAPGGTYIDGPSNGKFQGKDAAADAAWTHYNED